MKNINSEKLNAALRERLLSDIEAGRISGAVAIVEQNGRRVASVCEGYSDLGAKTPLKPNAEFRLASMTKPITAVALLICEERGLLSLSDKVSKYFPEFKTKFTGKKDSLGNIVKAESINDSLRIINLLTHSNGIATNEVGFKQYDTMTEADRQSLKTATDWYAKKLLLDFMPDSRDEYSPVAAFDIAARILEMVTGTTFREFIEENIFKPLGICDITCAPSDEQWLRTVKMHYRSEDGVGHTDDRLYRKRFENLDYTSGGACLISTAEDYIKFATMLLQGGALNGVRILNEKSVEKMKSPYKLWHQNENWGIGVRVINEDPHLPKGAFGWSGYYGSHFWIDMQNKIVAVFMKNSYFDGGAEAISSRNFEKDVYSSFD